MKFVDSRRYPNDENLTIGVNGFVNTASDVNDLKVDYVDVHDGNFFGDLA